MSGKFLEEVGFGEVIGRQDDVDKGHFLQARFLGGHKMGGDWNYQMETKQGNLRTCVAPKLCASCIVWHELRNLNQL